MGFGRRFREVREREVEKFQLKEEKEHFAYQDIKPETDITFEEAQKFWEDFMNQMLFSNDGKEE